jgi:hypothetical protein
VILALLLLSQTPAAAVRDAALGNPVAALGVDFAVPASPAFTFLGVVPTAVSRPGTLRAMGIGLLDGIDTGGTVRRGLAVDVSPYLLGWGDRLTIRRYQASALRRALARTQLSVATARAAGDSGATDLALGLRTTVLDHGDLRSDTTLTQLIGRLQLAALPDCPASATDPSCRARWRAFAASGLDSLNARLDSLRAGYARAHWNALRAELGAGIGWRAPGSRTDSLGWLGAALWANGAAPIGGHAQLAVTGQWRHRRDQVPRTGWQLAGRFLMGSTTFDAFAEVATARQAGTAAAGAEWRLAADLWLEAAVGTSFGTRAAPERLFTVANLKWALGERPRFAVP